MKKIISNLLFLIVFSYSISLSFLNPYNKKLFYNNEVYFIKSLFNNHYFNIKNNKLILSEKLSQIRFLETRTNTYFIDINKFYRIGINENNQIIIYNKYKNIKNINKIKMYWNFIKIKDNQYIIKNLFNEKYIMVNNQQIKFSDKINISEKNINKIFLFNIIKLFELGNFNNKNENNIIEKEPIDVLIKYIDLNDKTLNRKGIKQFYKDFDNEELRYSIRSILQYIPWIRKIFILMPNKKVKYFKSAKKIKDKIIYIKDKDLLGFDSANIYAFTFNLYKMGKFGISKNFIYMEDDFFIGKPLNKSDFFYYDIKKKKVFPYILTDYFTEIDIYQTLKEYNNLFKKKNSFHPHSGLGWKFSLLSTDKYFFERYKKKNNNLTLINTKYTHTAIAENIDDLKEVFKEIQNYKYINETLYSKERNILTLNQPHFVNLYQLNIKHKKVHSIPHKYIKIEDTNHSNLNIPLFVINTGGNHKPSIEQYKMQKYIMEKRFPFPTKYERITDIKKISRYFEFYFLFIFVIIKNYIKIKYKLNYIFI